MSGVSPEQQQLIDANADLASRDPRYTYPHPALQGTGPASYVQRAIDLTITLGEGSIGNTGFNTVKLSNLRIVATIAKAGFPSMDKASLRIYGVPPTIMNSISTLGIPLPMVRHNNAVLVEAGDAINGMATVYSGFIQNAWQDFDEIPETSLNIVAWGGADQAVFPVPPISFSGTADVATMLSGIAGRMGWGFENSGVSVQLSNPYFSGTALEQCHAIARAANIEMYADTGKSPITLAIWPKTGTRGGQIPLISAETGLVSYPKFRDQGMSFRCIFNPNVRIGGQIQMQSTVGGAGTATQTNTAQPATPAQGGPNGTWYVVSPFTYSLASQMPGGPWFIDVNCARTSVPGTSP